VAATLAPELPFVFIYTRDSTTMTDRQIIIPDDMRLLCEHAGYAPAVKVGKTLYCAGQVGRTPDLSIIEDPEQQFLAAWNNLRLVLEAGGCEFEDVVEMTTYHVDMHRHMPIFRRVKDKVFPRSTCAWTCIGVGELARPGLLVEIKCVAVER